MILPRFLNSVSFSKSLISWYQKNSIQHPWRQKWAESHDPYVVWVSEVMLQQTTIQAVLPVYHRFLNQYPTVQELAKASEEQVREAVRGLGYYRRFRFLHQAAQCVAEKGEWPQTYDAWRELPGVGEYTAAAVSSIAFDQPFGVVDGNVQRVFARLLKHDIHPLPQFRKKLQILLNEMIDTDVPGDFNQGLMELGQKICRPLDPRCSECPVTEFCAAQKEGVQRDLPTPIKRKASVDVRVELMIYRQKFRGTWRYGLQQRSEASQFLKGTKGFLFAEEGCGRGVEVGVVKHQITHHKISARIWCVDEKPNVCEWIEASDLEKRLVSSLDQKAWKLFQKKTLLNLVDR